MAKIRIFFWCSYSKTKHNSQGVQAVPPLRWNSIIGINGEKVGDLISGIAGQRPSVIFNQLEKYFLVINEATNKVNKVLLPNYVPPLVTPTVIPAFTTTPTLPTARPTVYNGINFLKNQTSKNFSRECPVLSYRRNSFWQTLLLALADLTGLSNFYLKCQ